MKNKRNYFTVLRYADIKKQIPLLILSVVITIIAAVADTIRPIYEGNIITFLFAKEKTETSLFVIECIKMLTCFVISFLSTLFSLKVLGKAVQGMTDALRRNAFDKITKLSYNDFSMDNSIDLYSVMTNDINNISSSFQTTILFVLSSTVSFVIIFFVLIRKGIEVFFVPLLLFATIMVTVTLISRKIESGFSEKMKAAGEFNLCLNEMVYGKTDRIFFDKGKINLEKENAINEKLLKADFRSNFYTKVCYPVTNLISFFFIAAEFLILGKRCLTGLVEIGFLETAYRYLIKIAGPAQGLSNIVVYYREIGISSQRMGMILKKNIQKDCEGFFSETEHKLEFKNVSFEYENSNFRLDNVSFFADEGETIAIVGKTGSGKTTIAKLLCGLYNEKDGKICMKDLPKGQSRRETVSKEICYVSQDSMIFDGNIYENARYGNENASNDEIKKTASELGIYEIINKLPKAFETNISNGEAGAEQLKKLIAILRAVQKEGSVLILDEATSTVDIRLEDSIRKAIKRATQRKTCIIIAHRLSSIVDADRILVLNEGRIVDVGKHKELLERNSYYKNMFNEG